MSGGSHLGTAQKGSEKVRTNGAESASKRADENGGE